MSRDNDEKKVTSEESFTLTISYAVRIPQKYIPALERGDLSEDVAVPSSLMLWAVFSPGEDSSVLALPLTGELCLLQLLQTTSDGEPTARTLRRWTPSSSSW